MNKAFNLLLFKFKRFVVFITGLAVIMSCLDTSIISLISIEVSAKQLTGTANDEYRKSIEEKYGYNIIIDDSVREKNALYTSPVAPSDAELKILKDIESSFAMLPDGFVKEATDFLKNRNFNPSITVRKKLPSDNEESAGWFSYSEAAIYVVMDGNDFIRLFLHEFGHEVSFVLRLKNKLNDLEKYFTEQNKKTSYPYDKNYQRLYDNILLDDRYKDIYLSVYSSKNFDEDFAETFAHSVMQPRYISSYGNGVKKPIHNKIEMLSKILSETFDTVKNIRFLMNCLPDFPAQWAVESVKKAKEKGIVPWNIYGLNNAELTRYDAALILQPFLYKYIDENTLMQTANLKKNPVIPEDFVYDVLDGEDILLLHNLRIITVGNKRFNPCGKIQKQSAAIILTKTAQLLGIEDTPKKELKCGDLSQIADWANAYVKFVLSLNIMSADNKNNFNPEKNITYQEFYISLLNICGLKEEYNKKNNIKLPSTTYLKTIGMGTSVSSTGWIYYYNYAFDHGLTFDSYTGKGREILSEIIYEGDFLNGVWHGKGKITWIKDGSWYEGDWFNNERHGKGKYVWSDGAVYEGEWKSGIRHGIGKMKWADGLWYEGEWSNDNFWNGKGNCVFTNGEQFEGEWKNGYCWNGKGKFYNDDGVLYEVQLSNGVAISHKRAA